MYVSRLTWYFCGLVPSAATAQGLECVLGVSFPCAMDVARLEGLRARGYRVEARALPREVTPVNRVILGAPGAAAVAAAATRAATRVCDGGASASESEGDGGGVITGGGGSRKEMAGGSGSSDGSGGDSGLGARLEQAFSVTGDGGAADGVGWAPIAASLPDSPWRRYT